MFPFYSFSFALLATLIDAQSNFNCDGQNSTCQQGEYFCDEGTDCTINCLGSFSCQGSTWHCPVNYKCTITAQDNDALSHNKIYGGTNGDLIVSTMGRYSVVGSKIYCPEDGHCNVTAINGAANPYSEFYEAVINATKSKSLYVYGERHCTFCGASIYCPVSFKSGSQNNCIVVAAGDRSLGKDVVSAAHFYSIESFTDLSLKCTHSSCNTTTYSIMHCGVFGYPFSCAMELVTGDTGYQCINASSECQGYTLFPTQYTTIDPTIDPSNDPTVDPTIDPTIYPTIDPTIYPSIDPTIDPSIDPTIDPTIDQTNDPSNDPTTDPTFNPTNDPTNVPTTFPSKSTVMTTQYTVFSPANKTTENSNTMYIILALCGTVIIVAIVISYYCYRCYTMKQKAEMTKDDVFRQNINSESIKSNVGLKEAGEEGVEFGEHTPGSMIDENIPKYANKANDNDVIEIINTLGAVDDNDVIEMINTVESVDDALIIDNENVITYGYQQENDDNMLNEINNTMNIQ